MAELRIDIEASVLEAAVRHAAQRGVSLQQLAEDFLTEYVDAPGNAPATTADRRDSPDAFDGAPGRRGPGPGF